jgi:serine/threonine protein kinase
MAQHGRYRIKRRVADGGMAEIFLAIQLGHEGFQKPVILKRIHGTIYADPRFRNMFIDEAHISMSLAHSNITQVLDLGVSAGRYFLVLELVDGWDLGRVIQRAADAGAQLPRQLALYICIEVCRALAYAHAKADGDRPLGIVHRDVSPHNILVSEHGEVKLTDFGIAKALNKREHTGTGVVKGKVAFMSPEQAMGKPIDARSDLFSLGTVLYLLLTGTLPFEAPSDLETLLRVQKGDYPPADKVAPDLPPEVAAVVSRAMSKDPDHRYRTADEMLVDLERVLRNAYQPVGQTELKRWLADLTAADGVQPISRSTARSDATGASAGAGDLQEEDVVMLETDADGLDGDDPASLAALRSGTHPTVRARSTHGRTAPMLPVPDDAETRADAASRGRIALPLPDTDERPGRRPSRRRGGFSVVVVGGLLVAGAWIGGKYARVWSDNGGGAAPSAADGGASGAAAPGGPAPSSAKPGPTPPRAEAPTRSASLPDGGAPLDARPPAAGTGAEPDTVARREPAGHRPHPPEHPAARRRGYLRDIAGLKMAPDPSLLPPVPLPPSTPAPLEKPVPTPRPDELPSSAPSTNSP